MLNCLLSDTLGGDDNVLTFDLYIEHTNFSTSGPFELALFQYFINIDPNIANGGTLSYTTVPGYCLFPSHCGSPPRTTILFGNILSLGTNFAPGAGSGPIISTTSPGTRVVKMKLVTTAYSFDLLEPLFVFRTGLPNPYTKIFAYIGTHNTDISQNGTFFKEIHCNDVLPVELASLTSSVNRNDVTINWTTSREINNSGFDIERKLISAADWTKIGNVAGNGNTQEAKNYTFIDRTNTGKYNYRLKQIDFNGSFKYYNLNSEVEVGVPKEYNISQNYPNPFNPTTKIDYDIPKDGKVSIILYDISGREVATLANEVKTAGYYSLQFNAINLASGMYFYRISSGNFAATKKMMVLK
ncbi:MAG: T9SS type A sorting domain-containing protein [bacterium]